MKVNAVTNTRVRSIATEVETWGGISTGVGLLAFGVCAIYTMIFSIGHVHDGTLSKCLSVLWKVASFTAGSATITFIVNRILNAKKKVVVDRVSEDSEL